MYSLLDEMKGVSMQTRTGPGAGGEKDTRTSPIDVHVGSRIRLHRMLLAMSQEQLGDALGLTFQQVQKYERGANRVSASRLFDLSRVLDVPISFFFDEMPETVTGVVTGRRPVGLSENREPISDDTMCSRETLALVRAYYRIADPSSRKKMFDLIKSMGPAEG